VTNRLASFLLLIAAAASGQPLRGVVDVHVHCDPDSMPRAFDALEAARSAREAGFRAIVLKNHFEPTASMAYLARTQAPGLEVFGGIVLNRTVGGINAAAVERMTRVKGGCGRIVWMPTFDAENQVRQSRESRPWVSVSRNGQLLVEVLEVLDVIASHKLVLATGHSSAEECLLLIREARKRGIERILVTHATLDPIAMSAAQAREAATLGAYVEFVYNALIGPKKEVVLQQYAEAIRAAGPDHCVLSSDLGQAGNPEPAEGLPAFFGGLQAQGFSPAEIDRMAKENPARLLGLP
jgi:hypothetical protein